MFALNAPLPAGGQETTSIGDLQHGYGHAYHYAFIMLFRGRRPPRARTAFGRVGTSDPLQHPRALGDWPSEWDSDRLRARPASYGVGTGKPICSVNAGMALAPETPDTSPVLSMTHVSLGASR
jgi:hypothetical protein